MLLTKGQIGFLALLLLIALGLTSLEVQAPVSPLPAETAADDFSAERAMAYLEKIATEPHSGGTVAHRQVKEYLLATLRQLGLAPEVQEATGQITYPGNVIAGRAYNIIARLPGTISGRSVLVMAHYDSQPQTPGAGDDGSGVAAILETIRALSHGPPLINDVIFLITDLEESGLLGARAFVDQHPLFDSVAVVLNFEARGNRGTPTTFEVSPENGWVMRAFAKAAPYPMANSVSYEIYRRMPNDTDFTPFREQGLTGLNTAFIDGFTHYHSMTDTPERLDQRSLQQQGANMLALVRHFGQISLEQTKAPDIIFFNPIGSWIIYYPAGWDLPAMTFLFGLFTLVVVLGLRRRRLQAGGIFAGTAAFFLTVIVGVGISWVLAKGVLGAYPHYQNFYSGNFYNNRYYLFAFLGLSLLVYYLIYSLFLRRWPALHLSAGVLLVDLLLLVAVNRLMPTGTFAISYPLLFCLLALLYVILRNRFAESTAISYGTVQVLGLLPALFLWIPMIDQFYVVFSLSMPLGAVALFILLLGLATPVLEMAAAYDHRLLPGLALATLIGGLVGGHLTAEPTPEHPLQTNLWYAADADADTAVWGSTLKQPDIWSQNYLKGGAVGPVLMLFPGRPEVQWLQARAPFLDLPPPLVTTLHDTTFGSPAKRVLELQVQSQRAAASINCWITPTESFIEELYLDGQMVRLQTGNSKILRINYHAPPADGIRFRLVMSSSSPLRLEIIDRTLDLPEALLTTPLPDNVIPGPGYLSHTIQVKKSFSY